MASPAFMLVTAMLKTSIHTVKSYKYVSISPILSHKTVKSGSIMLEIFFERIGVDAIDRD